MREWSAKDKKQITDLLKKVPVADRPAIRDAVKDMQAGDAIAYIKDMKASEKPFKPSASLNKPLKASETINTSIKPRSSQNKPVKVSASGAEERLERVQGEELTPNTPLDMADIENRVNNLITDFCATNAIDGMDGLRKAEQPIWQACSMYIGKHLFKGTNLLKDTTLHEIGSAAPTNNNRYDVDKVVQVITLYEYLCNVYGKVFTMWGVSAFCAIGKDFFYDHAEDLTRLSSDLKQKNEASLADAIASGRRNPTGALAALNHWHGWSGTSTNRTEVRETTVVYPVLVDINKSDREAIPDKQSQ